MACSVSTLLIYTYIICNVYSSCGMHNVRWGTQLTDSVIDVVAGISFLDCVKECQSRGRCLSVNYRRGTLLCELNSEALSSVNTKVESTSVYSGMQSWEKIMDDPCVDTPCGDYGRCIASTNGDTVNKYTCQITDCGPVNTSNNPGLVEVKDVGYTTIGVGSRRGFRCEGFLNNKIVSYIQCLPDGFWSTQTLQCVCDCRGFSSMMEGTTTIDGISNIPYTVTPTHKWLIIQRRCGGPESFYRTWEEYKTGFGSHDADFWIGNEIIYKLTSNYGFKILRVEMMDYEGRTYFVENTNFRISSESDKYRLHLDLQGHYPGNISNTFSDHNSMPFSTMDRDNDNHYYTHCAATYRGGWWYKACHSVNLNGLSNEHSTRGITWKDGSGNYRPMKFVRMMIRNR